MRIVFIDETDDWKDEIQKRYKKIYTAYVFNEKETNTCCSLSLNYMMIPIMNVVPELTESFDEEDLQYEGIEDSVSYMECKYIDSLPCYQIKTQVKDALEFYESHVDEVSDFPNWGELIDEAFTQVEQKLISVKSNA